jgi:hypothetical protein
MPCWIADSSRHSCISQLPWDNAIDRASPGFNDVQMAHKKIHDSPRILHVAAIWPALIVTRTDPVFVNKPDNKLIPPAFIKSSISRPK